MDNPTLTALRRLHDYPMNKPDSYLANYDVWFAPLRDGPTRLLELGVDRGGSLLLWRDYFQKGIVAGLDARLVRVEDPSGRIYVYQGRQDDVELLERIRLDVGGFHIVIDDCSHVATATRASFWHLFEKALVPGGLYVVEDWGTGYWQNWPDGHGYEGRSHEHGMVEFVKELVDECGAEDITKPQWGVGTPRASLFRSLTVAFGQALVVKA